MMRNQAYQAITIVLILAIVIVVLAIGANSYINKYANPLGSIKTTVIENKFIDLDLDGDADYIIKGEVIFNCDDGKCGGIPGQPEPLPTPNVFNNGGEAEVPK